MIPPIIALWAVFVAVMGESRNAYRATIPISNPNRSAQVLPKYPRSATSAHPEGNKGTVEFLTWARTKSPMYAVVNLNDNGDITRLLVDICYSVTDEELKVIAELSGLERLVLYTSDASDGGLKCLQSTKSLRELSIIGFSKSRISASAIQQLKRRNPSLEVNLSY